MHFCSVLRNLGVRVFLVCLGSLKSPDPFGSYFLRSWQSWHLKHWEVKSERNHRQLAASLNQDITSNPCFSFPCCFILPGSQEPWSELWGRLWINRNREAPTFSPNKSLKRGKAQVSLSRHCFSPTFCSVLPLNAKQEMQCPHPYNWRNLTCVYWGFFFSESLLVCIWHKLLHTVHDGEVGPHMLGWVREEWKPSEMHSIALKKTPPKKKEKEKKAGKKSGKSLQLTQIAWNILTAQHLHICKFTKGTWSDKNSKKKEAWWNLENFNSYAHVLAHTDVHIHASTHLYIQILHQPAPSQPGMQRYPSPVHTATPMLLGSPVSMPEKLFLATPNALNDTQFPNLALLFSLYFAYNWSMNFQRIFIYMGKLEKAVCAPEGQRNLKQK